jgi:hypothetical protein
METVWTLITGVVGGQPDLVVYEHGGFELHYLDQAGTSTFGDFLDLWATACRKKDPKRPAWDFVPNPRFWISAAELAGVVAAALAITRELKNRPPIVSGLPGYMPGVKPGRYKRPFVPRFTIDWLLLWPEDMLKSWFPYLCKPGERPPLA